MGSKRKEERLNEDEKEKEKEKRVNGKTKEPSHVNTGQTITSATHLVLWSLERAHHPSIPVLLLLQNIIARWCNTPQWFMAAAMRGNKQEKGTTLTTQFRKR
jgi:hypothetical protein